MWLVSSNDGRSWVRFDAGRFTASPDCTDALVATGPVEVAPMAGRFYAPTGPGDPTGVFLRARHAVGWPQQVTGQPPRVPIPDASEPGPDTPVN